MVCKMWIQLNPQTFCIFCSPVYFDEKVGGNEKKNMTTLLSYMIFFSDYGITVTNKTGPLKQGSLPCSLKDPIF